MTSKYHNQTLEFTDTLIRPSTTKGAVHINDGTGVFQVVAPTVDGQILISDAGDPNGAKWSAANAGVGFGITTQFAVDIPVIGSSTYFLERGNTTPNCFVLTDCTWELFTITPNRGAGTVDGWSTTPGNITGGHLDFYFGFVDASTATTTANFKYYATGTTVPPGTPDFQIAGTSINSVGTNFTSFSHMLGYTVVSGQQVCMRLVNNLTQSAAPTFHSFQSLNIFKTT